MNVSPENTVVLRDKCKHIMREIKELEDLSRTLIVCETDDERHFAKFLSKASGQLMNFRGVLNCVAKDKEYNYQARGEKNVKN